jgi:dUTP pyrophosphatase
MILNNLLKSGEFLNIQGDVSYSFPAQFEEDIKIYSKSIPYFLDDGYIIFTGVNAIDLLGILYKDKEEQSFIKNNHALFEYMPNCLIKAVSNDAVLPSKPRFSDVGYDISIIKEHKRFNSVTTLYDTGIQVSIEPGYYLEVVPRSSLSKSGYMLANSVGIIDVSYRGNIYIALTKIAPEAEDIEYPFRCCQLIVRKQVGMIIKETDNLEETMRNDGGFGSTG